MVKIKSHTFRLTLIGLFALLILNLLSYGMVSNIIGLSLVIFLFFMGKRMDEKKERKRDVEVSQG